MATKHAFRLVQRRFSSSGKVLSEEERAAENVFIKKMEKEKLEKLAREGPKGEQTPAAASTGGTVESIPADAKPSGSSSSTSSGVSTDTHRNYAVVAGFVTGLGALAWYLKTRDKKTEEVRD